MGLLTEQTESQGTPQERVASVYFPGGSDGKASVYNEGDLGSIPWSGRSAGEGNGNPLQYFCLENSMNGGACQATVHGVTKSWTRLSDFTFTFSIAEASLRKNPPAMQETRVRSLGWENPLEKEMAIQSSTIAWKIPWTEEPGRLQSLGSQRVGHD